MKKRSSKAGIILICGSLISMFWLTIVPMIVTPLWKKFNFLPERIYFTVEEFLALKIHHNSPYITIVGLIVFVTALIWSIKIHGKFQKWYEYLLVIVLMIFVIGMMLPCLCRPMEQVKRSRCKSQLKKIYIICNLYAQDNLNYFPDIIDNDQLPHSISYYGRGKKIVDSPFILLEDTENIHAGAMKHRIWSNGEIEKFYPWH